MKNLNKENIVASIQMYKSYLHNKYGVESIALIGSYSRDEQNDESDIDLIVEFNGISYSKLAGLAIFLETLFGKKVDIIRKRKNMKRALFAGSQKDAIYV